MVSERAVVGVSCGFGFLCGMIGAGFCCFHDSPHIQKIGKLAGITSGLCGSLIAYRILMAKRNHYLKHNPLDFLYGYQQNQIAQRYDEHQTKKVFFSDVIGLDAILVELKDFVSYFNEIDRYKKLGARLPRGILLEGVPGSGKTMIARAFAAEAGCAFLYASASSFVEMYVGVGAKRIRDLFEHARTIKPVIIFLDELDALGAVSRDAGANPEYRQSLNELLCQMDGFKEEEDLLVIGATNNASALDAALKRSGRFDRLLHIPLLDQCGRYALLSHIKQKKYVADISTVYLEELSYMTEGLTAADIKNIFNSAAFLAVREKKSIISEQHLRHAFTRILNERRKGLLCTESSQ